MSNRTRKRPPGSTPVSRRELLKAGGLVISTTMLLPRWMRANAQVATTSAPSTFTYYISPSGSDSNPGTLAAPWAITALNTRRSLYTGKSVGLIAGSYDLTNTGGVNLMAAAGPGYYAAALEVDGGTSSSPTYIASCNASGAYAARGAVLDAKGSSGVYGGYSGTAHSQTSILRHGNTMPHQGYLVLDGLVFQGMLTGGVQIGTFDVSQNLQGIIIQNCEFRDQNGVQPDHYCDNNYMLELNNGLGFLVHNNYFHDGYGWTTASDDHFSSVLCWLSQGTTVEYNTCVNASNIYGKENANQGSTLRYNYVQTRAGFPSGGFNDWTGAVTAGLTQTTSVYNNVLIVGQSGGTFLPTLGSTTAGLTTPLEFYNNTVVLTYTGICQQHFGAWTVAGDNGQIAFFNNLFAGNVSPDRKMIGVNAKAWQKCAYNLYPASPTFRVLNATSSSPDSSSGDYSSLSTYVAAVIAAGGISAMETGSATTSLGVSSLFSMGSATFAQQYKLASSSPAVNAGRSDGTSSGTMCDIGAWGNGATWIGCNFAYVGPDAPVLDQVT